MFMKCYENHTCWGTHCPWHFSCKLNSINLSALNVNLCNIVAYVPYNQLNLTILLAAYYNTSSVAAQTDQFLMFILNIAIQSIRLRHSHQYCNCFMNHEREKNNPKHLFDRIEIAKRTTKIEHLIISFVHVANKNTSKRSRISVKLFISRWAELQFKYVKCAQCTVYTTENYTQQ